MCLLSLGIALASVGCVKQVELPEDGISDEELVRLEGPPVQAHPTERLRVLVAEFGMGLDSSTQAYREEHLETFCEYAAVYQPDLVVLYDVPFAGAYVGEHDVAEDLAVCLDAYHRTLFRTHIPRRREVPLAEISAGPLVLSELPLRGQHWGEIAARPLAPFYLPSTSSRVLVDLFDQSADLRIGDGVGPLNRMAALQINRSDTCTSELGVPGQFPICVTPPYDWEALRHEATDNFAELGLRALKVEFSIPRAEDSGPVAP